MLTRLGAWSRLETLDLGPELMRAEQPGVLGLVPFAVHYLRLRSLRIRDDANIDVPILPATLTPDEAGFNIFLSLDSVLVIGCWNGELREQFLHLVPNIVWNRAIEGKCPGATSS
ncbi:hypothetical protein C8R44DRAFT_853669 [Mycena epipterygia]|nr:hypothetical protein C8R44DRAFT_853669 [Mycena epipterygia]